MTLEELISHTNQATNQLALYRRGRPYTGFAESIRQLKLAGHNLHIITSRADGTPEIMTASTVAWLTSNNIPYDSLTFTKHKTPFARALDCHVDDDPRVCDQINAANGLAYLIVHPYNKSSNITDRLRKTSFADFANQLLQNQ